MIEERIRLNRIRREQELRRHILLFVVSAAIILVLAIAGGSFISRAQAPGRPFIINILPASVLNREIRSGHLPTPMRMGILNPGKRLSGK